MNVGPASAEWPGPVAVTLTYDPLGRLVTSSASATTTMMYAGDALVGEYDASGAILRRYAPGVGTDEPVVWYQGAGTTGRRWLHADTQGSIIGYSDASGASGAAYGYDRAPGRCRRRAIATRGRS